MKARLLVLLILFFSFHQVYADDNYYQRGGRLAESLKKSFQHGAFKKGINFGTELYRKYTASEKETPSEQDESKNTKSFCPDRIPDSAMLQDGELYYLFSFSMPESLIRKRLAEAERLFKEKGIMVKFVVRGFYQNFKETLKRYLDLVDPDRKYIRKNQSPPHLISITLNPFIFATNNISSVPAIVIRKDERTGIILGDVSFEYALNKFNDEIKDYGILGPTYDVAELTLAEIARQKEPELRQYFQEIYQKRKELVKKLFRLNGKYKFTKAKKTHIRYYDPTIVVTDDIKDHQGRVIVKAGTTINPLERVALMGRIVIIDGNDPQQAEFAARGDFYKIILIAGDAYEFMKKYKKRAYLANDLIVEKFGVRKVPLVIEQYKKLLKLTEIALQ